MESLRTNACACLDIYGPTHVVGEDGFALGRTLWPSAPTPCLPNTCGRVGAGTWVEHVVWSRARVPYPGRPDTEEVI